MRKIAGFIVDNRKIILLAFVLFLAYCVWGMGQVDVEYDITAYLPESTDTQKALMIMEEEFGNFGLTTVMVKNISFEEADALYEQFKDLDGILLSSFENTEDYYKDSCALFSITFEGDKENADSLAAHNTIMELLEPYETYVSMSLTDSIADMLIREVTVILVMAVILVTVVLLITSQSYIDIFVFGITFLAAALTNIGTNFWLGTISFISNTVCIILQLALAIDYAIILSHRYAEERAKGLSTTDAMKEALSKAVPEISSSSLTTIAGLLALTTMTMGLGKDLGIVLAKSIVCSMVVVFLFMPCIILLFSKAIEKTKHKNFVPKVPFIGRFAVKFRYVIIPLFLILFIVGALISGQIDYAYYSTSIDCLFPSDTQIAEGEIFEVFGETTEFVVLMPGKDYDRQKELMDKITAYPEIKTGMGLPNTELKLNGVSVFLTEKINYKRLADLLATDAETADGIFSAYAFLSEDETDDGVSELALYQTNKDIYKISLLDLCDCALKYDDFIAAALYYDSDAYDSYNELSDLISKAKDQLVGENWCRLLFVVNSTMESETTFGLIDNLMSDVKAEYPEAVFAGASMSAYDLDASFSVDNLKVSLFTIGFVFIILVFTFRSFGLPILLTMTIQGAIFVNFAYYPLVGINMFFFVYLIISAVQMGATIDYAIVITSRYLSLKPAHGKKDAIIMALSEAFPTVMTSGLIMSCAGFLMGIFVSEPMISTMGTSLGRGVIVSVASVMLLLPAILYTFDKFIEKTAWKPKEKKPNLLLEKIKRLAFKERTEDDEND